MPTTDTPLSDFASLLDAAGRQDEPQRLLFVFARRELPEHATAGQQEQFERGRGGNLVPCLCVDKLPDEIPNFDALAADSVATGESWDVVFVGSLAGRGGIAPNPDEADQPLHFMVNAVNEGRIEALAAFDRDGHALRFM